MQTDRSELQAAGRGISRAAHKAARHLTVLVAGAVMLTTVCGVISGRDIIQAERRSTVPPAHRVLPPAVKIAAILQTRGLILSKFKTPYIDALNRKLGLRIILAVSGSEFVHPVGISNLHIYSSELEGGGRLRLLSPVGPTMKRIDTALYAAMRQDGAIGFPIELRFAPAPPAARQIRHFTGSFIVHYGGKVQVVTIPHISRGIGKMLVNPAFKTWHIHLHLLPLHTANKRLFLTLLLQGPPGCFRSVGLVHGSKTESSGYFSELLAGGATRVTIPLSKPPGNDTGLRLRLKIDEKTRQVRFHMTHVPLP